MRAGRLPFIFVALVSAVSLAGAAGCGPPHEAEDPSGFARASGGAVRCSADEDGNLHVRAPASARVIAPRDAPEGATAEIAYEAADMDLQEYPQMPRPVRPRSRSLGFIGDAPLTQGPNHGGRFSHGAHDNLLPPHGHGGWAYGNASRSGWSAPGFVSVTRRGW